jgi:hypothetical protein
MTLIETQKDKQNPYWPIIPLNVTADLYKGMKKSGFEMIPYGAGESGLPDSGIVSFMETPRFSTGLPHSIT